MNFNVDKWTILNECRPPCSKLSLSILATARRNDADSDSDYDIF